MIDDQPPTTSTLEGALRLLAHAMELDGLRVGDGRSRERVSKFRTSFYPPRGKTSRLDRARRQAVVAMVKHLVAASFGSSSSRPIETRAATLGKRLARLPVADKFDTLTLVLLSLWFGCVEAGLARATRTNGLVPPPLEDLCRRTGVDPGELWKSAHWAAPLARIYPPSLDPVALAKTLAVWLNLEDDVLLAINETASTGPLGRLAADPSVGPGALAAALLAVALWKVAPRQQPKDLVALASMLGVSPSSATIARARLLTS
ncbi:MAG: hypothetical protein Kow0069_34160 [Promethearchaeota archaeon]